MVCSGLFVELLNSNPYKISVAPRGLDNAEPLTPFGHARPQGKICAFG